MSNYQVNQDLILSCLQQSIRKGYTDLALEYFDQLYSIDKSLALYKLSVILIEDIGLANISLVHNFLETQLKSQSINQNGGNFYLHQIIKSMCYSPKDRSCYELHDFSKFYIEEYNMVLENYIVNENQNKFLEILYDQSLPLVQRFLAGCDYFSSKKLNNIFQIKETDLQETFQYFETDILNNKELSHIMKNSFLIHKEPYFVSLSLLDSIYHHEQNKTINKWKTGEIITNESKPHILTNNWLFDGFSQSTQLSNQIFDLFLQQKSPINEYLEDFSLEQKKDILFYLFYRHTGQHTNKRLIYPTAIALVKVNQSLQFSKLTNNTKELQNTITVFDESLPKLYDSIETVLKTPNPKFFPF